MFFKKYKNSIFIILFILNFLKAYSFRLDNLSFNERIDTNEGGYREFYLTNDSLIRKRYKMNVISGSKNDGAKYVEVFPKVITINPKSKGIVKVFVKAPKETPKGEYDFKLQFQPINIPTLAQNTQGKIEGTSHIMVAPILQMQAYVGEVDFTKHLKLENIKVLNNENGGISVKSLLSNTSYASIDFGAEAYGKNNFLYESVYVADLPGNTKNLEVTLHFPKIKNTRDLRKIIFYRTPSNTRKVIKEIEILQ
ncbi:hypothetical protein [uncultured Cetobacterium sp.]|uniref:hypothetical protein n=1 Tax=uncultured Cetobacterium sp. TaxID=527638 RepID=UPI0026119038|nr:hypothetical protein [uncultured Cetobacterium sp.]